MIKTKIVLKKETIKQITTTGHACYPLIFRALFPKLNYYHNLCTALSTLEYHFIYSLELMTQITFDTNIKKGFFDCQINQMSQKDSSTLKVLSQSFLIGIEMIKKKHKTMLDYEIKKVS